jgi:2-octaprenyl-3-methyl-6-methoxy-1,4-benzoquinol hydroxylase
MYDFCINGGGMVGAALALGLAKQQYRVAIIEPHLPKAFDEASKPDLRVSAISDASVSLLTSLGAWEYIETMRVKPYTGLSVWDDPAHRTDFTAKSIDVPQLGFFVENRLLQLGCHQALKAFDNVTWFTGCKVTGITLGNSSVSNSVDSSVNSSADSAASLAHAAILSLDIGETIHAKWLIGADGAASQVRQSANIGVSGWQYRQQAMGITIEMTNPVDAITWQEFTPEGPKAFLPMFDNYASLVWYDSPDELKRLSTLNAAQLKQAIIEAFPSELIKDGNDFTVLDKATFPLTRAHASRYVTDRVILVGDAAHTINPLAGQGVNLGFRDVETLLAVTGDGIDLTSLAFKSSLITSYEKPRQRDNALMMSAMDGFYGLFSNDIGPIKWFRNQLLSVAQHFEPAKREVLKYAIGMREWKF